MGGRSTVDPIVHPILKLHTLEVVSDRGDEPTSEVFEYVLLAHCSDGRSATLTCTFTQRAIILVIILSTRHTGQVDLMPEDALYDEEEPRIVSKRPVAIIRERRLG